jgi:hypothetical protein
VSNSLSDRGIKSSLASKKVFNEKKFLRELGDLEDVDGFFRRDKAF